MGQAKSRGNKEQRIALAKERVECIPEEGVYISLKNPYGIRFMVEEVTVLEAEENEGEEGFFLAVTGRRSCTASVTQYVKC